MTDLGNVFAAECTGPVDYWNNMASSSMMPPTMSSAPMFHPSTYSSMPLPIDSNMYLNAEMAGLPSMPHFRNGSHSQAPPSLIPSSYSTPNAQMNIPSSQMNETLGKALASSVRQNCFSYVTSRGIILSIVHL